MEFWDYLNFVLLVAAWALKNLDLFLGGLSLVTLCLNPGPEVSQFPLILMAVIGLGIRIARIILRKRAA